MDAVGIIVAHGDVQKCIPVAIFVLWVAAALMCLPFVVGCPVADFFGGTDLGQAMLVLKACPLCAFPHPLFSARTRESF